MADDVARRNFVETYRIEEFKAVRSEIERHLTDIRATERYVLLADAAIYAAIVFRSKEAVEPSLVSLAWWLPTILGVLGVVRWRESSDMVGRLGFFVRQNEPDGVGWENFLVASRRAKKRRSRYVWYFVFWALAIGGTAGLAYYQNALGSYRLMFSMLVGFFVTVVVGFLVLLPEQEDRFRHISATH